MWSNMLSLSLAMVRLGLLLLFSLNFRFFSIRSRNVLFGLNASSLSIFFGRVMALFGLVLVMRSTLFGLASVFRSALFGLVVSDLFGLSTLSSVCADATPCATRQREVYNVKIGIKSLTYVYQVSKF